MKIEILAGGIIIGIILFIIFNNKGDGDSFAV